MINFVTADYYMHRKKYLYIYINVLMLLVPLAMGAGSFCRVRPFDIYDGLPANNVSSVAQGENDLIWVSTWNGLCFYDGYGFTAYKSDSDGAMLSTNRIVTSRPVPNGNVWIHTYDRNMYLLERSGGKFVNVGAIVAEMTGKPLAARNIYVSDSLTWISCDRDLAGVRVKNSTRFNPEEVTVLALSECAFGAKQIRKVVMDSIGNEWIITDKGVQLYGKNIAVEGYIVDVVTVGKMTCIIASDGVIYLYDNHKGALIAKRVINNGSKVTVALPYGSDRVVLGTTSGVGLYSPLTGRFELTAYSSNSAFTPVQMSVDSKGRVWTFGTIAGVELTDMDAKKSRHLQSYSEGLAGVRSVRPIWHEDEFGTVWLVPVDGVFGFFDESSGKIESQPLTSGIRNFNSFPVLERGMSDHQGNLWLTSTHGLMLLNFRRHNMRFSQIIGNDEPRALVELRDGSVLAGTADGYLVVCKEGKPSGFIEIVDKGNGILSYKVTDKPVKFSYRIYALAFDKQDRLWVGTKGRGLYMLEANGALKHFTNDARDPYSLSDDQVYDVDVDNDGNIWIGSYGGGVNLVEIADDGKIRFLNANNRFKDYPANSFLRVRRVTHDTGGVVYLSTTDGLLTFSNKFLSEGGKPKFFSNRHDAANPESLRTDNVMQTFVASDGKVYVATMGGAVQTIREKNPLDDNLHFVTLKSESEPGTAMGPTTDGGSVWSIMEDSRKNICIVNETSIEVHSPTGEVTVFGPDDMQANLKFSEAKPLFVGDSDVMLLSTLGGLVTVNLDEISKSGYSPTIVFTGVRFQGDRAMRRLLDIEHIDVEPDKRNLSLYFAALDYSNNYLLRYAYKFESESEWTYLHNNHTVHLNNLSPGKHRLIVRSTNGDGVWVDNESVIELDVIPMFWETVWAKVLYLLIFFLLLWAGLYFYFMKRKNRLLSELREQEAKFYSDVSHKLRTPLTLIGSPVSEVLRTESLSDTARNHLERVERNSANMLSLVDSMIKKNYHGGDDVYISDDNVPPHGELSDGNHESVPTGAYAGDESDNRELLLVVEDNDDLRSYLYDILSSRYHVALAANGKAGLEKAADLQPDFIITDVTMPEMDGLTMVHNIKQNKSLSHIPILVLSAKASERDRIEGLKEGIDDYITKPFSATYLRQRIAGIIAQRRILQQAYLERINDKYSPVGEEGVSDRAQSPVTEVAETGGEEVGVEMTPDDKALIDNLLEFMYSRIEDENLRIEDLADAVGLGRTVFYGKIKSLLGVSPSDFLRRIRMQRAERLITDTSLTFSEIAFSVGFSDPKYFTKCFKKETGLTPSEYRKKNQTISA